MQKLPLPTPLTRIATERYGPALSVRRLGSGSGNAAVYLWTGSEARGVVKVYDSTRTFGQELHAYRAWTTALGHVPSLHAAHERAPLALFIGYVPGEPLSERHLPRPEEAEVHRRAGAWLRGLHEVPFVDRDPMPLTEAYEARLESWLDRCRSQAAAARATRGAGFSPALEAWLTERLHRALLGMADAERVPCHRDWEPRNWLVDPGGAWLAAIDFEHARPDFALADLTRLAAYVWPSRPDLREAFTAGYGAAWTDLERDTIHALAAFEAAQRFIWAEAQGDEALLGSALASLVALGAPVR